MACHVNSLADYSLVSLAGLRANHCLYAGSGESGPAGSNQWERTLSMIDFNLNRPNGTGERAALCTLRP
jgi:hypothetical protein